MAIFVLVFTLLMAFLAITLLLGIAPISSKAKVRFHAVLIFAIAVGYFCIAVAYMEKYNIVKRKNQKLEEPLL